MNHITPIELKQRIDSGENLHIIDVREPAEYEWFNIGGKLVPLGLIQSFQLEGLEDLKNEEVIIHCKVGGRSMQACMILEQAGFKNVSNLTGGIMAWMEVNK